MQEDKLHASLFRKNSKTPLLGAEKKFWRSLSASRMLEQES
jgi:hypothetical protein